jgi:hypothetical protein
MNDEDNQDQARDVGQRIASLIRSIGQGPEKQIAGEELQELKAAADRLDQMLKAAADADLQVLKNAADRLDRLLVDIHKGKDVTNRLRKSRERQEPKR